MTLDAIMRDRLVAQRASEIRDFLVDDALTAAKQCYGEDAEPARLNSYAFERAAIRASRRIAELEQQLEDAPQAGLAAPRSHRGDTSLSSRVASPEKAEQEP